MFICRLVSLLSLLTLSLAHEAATLHFLSPHPLAGIPVDSESATTMLQHYGKPPAECEEDEKAFQISGVPGMVCAPTCDPSGGCPSDLPDGVTARPQCALENRATGDKYCVLICQAGSLRGNVPLVGDGQCGEAECQMVQAGLGICTWDL